MPWKLMFTVVVTAWALSEIAMALFKRAGADRSKRTDRGSLPLLVGVILTSALAGLTIRFGDAGKIFDDEALRWGVGLAIVLAGIAFRWHAILTLGALFTTNVAIQSGHRLVRSGAYRFLRHPSYAGTLVILGGIALATNGWINAALVMLPCTAAIVRRIRIEEAALLEAFGQEYREFSLATSRLIPGVY
jgi:protein-S-isoprenylcysteine O-methyltransferase